jgi:hypothetical protein
MESNLPLNGKYQDRCWHPAMSVCYTQLTKIFTLALFKVNLQQNRNSLHIKIQLINCLQLPYKLLVNISNNDLTMIQQHLNHKNERRHILHSVMNHSFFLFLDMQNWNNQGILTYTWNYSTFLINADFPSSSVFLTMDTEKVTAQKCSILLTHEMWF